MTLGAASFCVAGAALAASLARFAWQVQHLEHLRLVFAWQAQHLEHLHRGPQKFGDKWWLWAPARFAWQAQHLEHLRYVLRGRRSAPARFAWQAHQALGVPQVRFAWQAQHLEHLTLVLCGRRSTWSTVIDVRGSLATSDDFGHRVLLRGKSSTWSGSFCVAGAPLGVPQVRFVILCGRCSTFIEVRVSPATAPFCMAGAALGAPPARFAWQAQHLEHLTLVLCGRRSTWSTVIDVRGSLATSDDFGHRVLLRGKSSTWSGSFCVAGAPLGVPQVRFVILCGRCSTFIEVRVSPATAPFCMAGAALGAPPARFAWQAQHLEHLRLALRGMRRMRSTWSTFIGSAEVRRQVMTLGAASFLRAELGASQSHFAWQVRHSLHVSLILRGSCSTQHLSVILRSRCSTWRTSVSFCVAGASLGAPSTQHHLHYIIRHTIINTTPSPLHHQHNLINTTSSTHYHLHNTIYTIPSTQNHPHNTIYTTPSNTPSSTQHHVHNIINTT